MAKFRMVHTDFWNDPKVVEEMTPEDKFFFLYLLTNSSTTQIGIYQITKKQMAFDTGYSIESINSLLDRFIRHHGIVAYNSDTREIALKNWGRYNFNRGGKPILDCVTAELKDVKDRNLIKYVGESVERKEVKVLYDTYHDTPTISGQEEEKEEEEEEEEEEYTVRDLFDHYISKNIIQHSKMTNPIKSSIRARLRDYTYEQLIQVIDNYSKVYFGDNYWFTHKYTLADLMRDKDVRKFIDEAEPLKNFAKHVHANGTKAKSKEAFDLS
ncbi:chromosomal replication initiator DnaA [Virgibacillus litoralis]|uniref:DNA replication protein DnaD n=1 Tax=Virgibacillus litoralis TaxID=578221 RepID=A0ABS4HH55_9BACI|nr:chromosomal replication initiator DnaA [Virgibacillus litoralis]MBP1950259.1 hypothetical protein [Virgibacillus litoralis]